MLDEGTFHHFDLERDPLEAQNVFSPGDRSGEALKSQLLAWIREHDDSLAAEGGSVPVEMDDKVLESLRALGYVE